LPIGSRHPGSRRQDAGDLSDDGDRLQRRGRGLKIGAGKRHRRADRRRRLLATASAGDRLCAVAATSRLSVANAAAVAAHYGSISIVTFVAATQVLQVAGLGFDGALIAVAAVMEMPAIVVALVIARRFSPPAERPGFGHQFLERGALNSSIVMLLGSFVIGWISGEPGLDAIAPLIVDPFRGILALFLLDMGLIAGRGLARSWRELKPPVMLFGLYMPLVSAAAASAAAMVLGLMSAARRCSSPWLPRRPTSRSPPRCASPCPRPSRRSI
jgi:hypothetical protein